MHITADPDPKVPVYEPLPGESARAFRAWELYRDAGPGRRMNAIAIHPDVDTYPATMTKWSREWKWAVRLANYNEESKLIVFKQHHEDLAVMEGELVHTYRIMIDKFNQLLSQIDVLVLQKNTDVVQMANAMDKLVKCGRLLMGQSTANVAQKVQVENLSTEQLEQLEQILGGQSNE